MGTIDRRQAAFGVAFLLVSSACQSRPKSPRTGDGELAASAPSISTVRNLLRHRIDVQRQSMGMAIGLVGPNVQRTICHGVLGAGDVRPVSGDTVFPVASITKVFTALLLADAVERGEMRLEDPVTHHIPGLRLQLREGREITLFDLVTHTAGFPTYPSNYPPENQTAHRVGYTHDMLYAALAEIEPQSPPEWRYSSIGPQLVADALAHRTGVSFEDLLRRRVTGPLGMESTAFAPTRSMAERLALSHDIRLKQVTFDEQPAMPAAGDLLSTADDMTNLLSAFMVKKPTPLAPAMAAMSRPRIATAYRATGQAIGLQTLQFFGDELLGHNGSKNGSSASLQWLPGRLGIIVLSNAAPPVDDIARHLIDPRIPLNAPVKMAEDAPSDLERYVGRYIERSQSVIFVVSVENGELVFEAVGQAPKIALSPEGPDAFNIPRMGARIEFRSSDLVWLSLAGQEYLADRVRTP